MSEAKTVNRTTFHRSAETQWLIDRLLKAEELELITYEELKEVAGCDVREKRYILQAARKVLEREHHIKFGVEPRVGIRRLDSVGVLGSLDSRMRRTRNSAHRGKVESLCVREEELDEAQRARLLSRQSLFAFIAETAKPKRVSLIEEAVAKKPRRVDWREMLDEMRAQGAAN